jgi:hypothetical protein
VTWFIILCTPRSVNNDVAKLSLNNNLGIVIAPVTGAYKLSSEIFAVILSVKILNK